MARHPVIQCYGPEDLRVYRLINSRSIKSIYAGSSVTYIYVHTCKCWFKKMQIVLYKLTHFMHKLQWFSRCILQAN